jgi:Holliday junction resolvase
VTLSPKGRYAKGRRLEYKTMRHFEAAGLETFRMAGSHSPFDVIAVGSVGVIFAQVKGGTAGLSAIDREKIREFKVPKNCVKLLVRWPDRAKFPLTEEIK